MEIQDLKDICVSIFELTNPTDKYPHSKIITDNISDDILQREISFLDVEYGYTTKTRIDDFICDTTDDFHDVFGVSLFNDVKRLFKAIFVSPADNDFTVNFQYRNGDIEGIVRHHIGQFIKRCNELKDFIKIFNDNGQLDETLNDEEIRDFDKAIDIVRDTIVGYFDDELIKDLPFEKMPEETMTPEEYYENFKGKFVSYKGKMDGKVAGYVEHYLIIGFDDERGCIKSFSPQVTYDKDYKSYRFSKMKNLTPF